MELEFDPHGLRPRHPMSPQMTMPTHSEHTPGHPFTSFVSLNPPITREELMASQEAQRPQLAPGLWTPKPVLTPRSFWVSYTRSPPKADRRGHFLCSGVDGSKSGAAQSSHNLGGRHDANFPPLIWKFYCLHFSYAS